MSTPSPALRVYVAGLLVGGFLFSGHAMADDVPMAEPVAEPISMSRSIESSVRPLKIDVKLINETILSGTLTDKREILLQTSFGNATIPLSEVAGIRLASSDDAMTTIVMLNGDTITGATDVEQLIVETEWGTATINGTSVASLMFVPSLVWDSQPGLNGKRWSLVDVKKAAAPVVDAAAQQQAQMQQQLQQQSQQYSSQGMVRYPNGTVAQPAYRSR